MRTMWLALFFAAIVMPSASPQPILQSCVADNQVDAHIDPRLPSWVRVEIRAVMLSLPPCLRRGTVGSDDIQGRFITNDYDDYVRAQAEWGSPWARVDQQSWRAPSGALIEMPYEPVPPWLIGAWSCNGEHANRMEVLLRPNFTGSVRDFTTMHGVNEQGRFVEQPSPTMTIELYAYRASPLPTIYAGLAHQGIAYGVQRTPNGLILTNWGFFRDDMWNAMPTQPQWSCTRVS